MHLAHYLTMMFDEFASVNAVYDKRVQTIHAAAAAEDVKLKAEHGIAKEYVDRIGHAQVERGVAFGDASVWFPCICDEGRAADCAREVETGSSERLLKQRSNADKLSKRFSLRFLSDEFEERTSALEIRTKALTPTIEKKSIVDTTIGSENRTIGQHTSSSETHETGPNGNLEIQH